MKKNWPCFFAICLLTYSLFYGSGAYAFEDAESMPMLAPAKAPLTSENFEAYVTNENQITVPLDKANVLLKFKRNYQSSNKPKLIFFMGRTLTDQVSDWSTQERWIEHTINLKQDATVTNISHSELQKKKPTYQEQSSGEIDFLAEVDQFFLEQNAKLVDRNLIIRLTSSDQSKNTNLITDSQLIEINALKDYADYLIEVNRIELSDGIKFHYSIKAIQSGELLMREVTTVKEETEEPNEKMVLTESGYRYVMLPERRFSENEIARQLALEIMNSLNTVF